MSWRWLRPAIRLPAGHRHLAIAGWALYAASWVTPGLREGHLHIGAAMFVTVIRLGLTLVLRSGSLPAVVVGLLLLGAWLANFSLFVQLRMWSRIAWIVLPWVPFALALHAMHAASVPRAVVSVLYFYPWAIGIALVHIAAIADARRPHHPTASPSLR
ncbi:MAG TPA: hypothetical protein VGL55_08730 [Steroidobacteraceae bacterium]|jgi:hypothetical protein